MEVMVVFSAGGDTGYHEAESLVPPTTAFPWWTVHWQNVDGYDKKAFYSAVTVKSLVIREETAKEDGTISQD